jgi:hypothetical protein
MKYLIVITLIVFISSCKVQKVQVQRSPITSHAVGVGGTKYGVESKMGPPVSRELDRNVEEWHYCYCNTGMSLYEFLTVFFHDGGVVESVYYTVTFDEAGSATDPCWKFLKMGDYYVPYKIQNLRRN